MDITSQSLAIPKTFWLLASIIGLATGSDNSAPGSGRFARGLDIASYLHVAVILAENLLAYFDNVGWASRGNQEVEVDADNEINCTGIHLLGPDATCQSLKMSYVDLLKPICQQHHLMGLLTMGNGVSFPLTGNLPQHYQESVGKCGLSDIAGFYSCILRIFSILNPVLGSLPVLNMISFTPGFLTQLWGEIERILFSENIHTKTNTSCSKNNTPKSKSGEISQRKQKKFSKDGGNKWVNVLQKITRTSHPESSNSHSIGSSGLEDNEEQCSALWDHEPLREGPGSLSSDMSRLLHLFCASYSHLLLVLDDIEFYDKQV